jgi:hypothetical protein
MARSSTIRRYAQPSAPSVLRPQPQVPKFIATSFVQPRAAMPDSVAIGQMAEDMREGAYREGGVTEADLLVRGWTPAQITRLAAPARQLAQRRAGFC